MSARCHNEKTADLASLLVILSTSIREIGSPRVQIAVSMSISHLLRASRARITLGIEFARAARAEMSVGTGEIKSGRKVKSSAISLSARMRSSSANE